MNEPISRAEQLYASIEDNKTLLAIRDGMVMAMPAIFAGSIALLLQSFPIPAYQQWIAGLRHGAAAYFLSVVQNATLGIISLIMLLTVSYSYEKMFSFRYSGILPFVNLCSYLAFTASRTGGFSFRSFESIYLFNALVITILSSILFRMLNRLFLRRLDFFADGTRSLFQTASQAIIPACITVAVFALLNVALTYLFGSADTQSFFSAKMLEWFQSLGRNLGSGLLFIFLMHFTWFFGIHGSNLLDNVARNVFALDTAAVGTAGAPILSKTFFDAFVVFGGCGALTCLLLAIMLCDKRKGMRRLARLGAAPALFNMNEIILFGVPVVLNPIYFVPFLATPLLLTLVSYLCVRIGLVPPVIHQVEWTTPILLSGYAATGSIAGSLLQLFNLIVGTAVYIPFVRMAQNRQKKAMSRQIRLLTQEVQNCELTGKDPRLLHHTGPLLGVAKQLSGDLRAALKEKRIQLYYQPQINADGQMIGAEALLRWEHPLGGMLYPPLVIALAEESGCMEMLGDYILDKACRETVESAQLTGQPINISVNLTASQLESGNLSARVRQILQESELSPSQLGLEITEQTALSVPQDVIADLMELRSLGVRVIMDDFGMGHNSMVYLQNGQFDEVKLDGVLVKDLTVNQRCGDIISSIIYLSNSLHFDVIAEFVETVQQKEALEKLGCFNFQGYLFSPAIPKDELVTYISSLQK